MPKQAAMLTVEVVDIQCLDPHHYTGGGTVTFRIFKLNDYSHPSRSGEDDYD